MDKEKRKDLLNSYKNREVIGGVYCIVCSGNQHRWIRSTTDLEGTKTRFRFSMKMNGSPEPAMNRELQEYGVESFSFQVLEELKKTETQTAQEFASDVRALLSLWKEKEKA